MALEPTIDLDEVLARLSEQVLRVPPPETPSQWAGANLKVTDGPLAGSFWSAEQTPYIVEPLDMIGPDSPVQEIAVMKSAQTGFTTMLIAAIGHSIANDPCRMMLLQPTDAALSDFNREKLVPTVEASRSLARLVEPQKSRSGEGSTTYSKKFPGGSLTMAIASSAADLRSKTIKKLFRDEIDEYPDDLDGQGDPLSISDARLTAFISRGDWKKVDISTPTIKGGSKIERRYEEGDMRRWRVPCQHCDGEFTFEFGPHFRYNQTFPFEAHYVAPCCGAVIQEYDKRAMVRKGRWVATDPRPGAFPSYHFDAMSSPLVTWDDIAKKALAAGDNETRLKSFYNLVLGLPYEIRGDAPDHVRLLERREIGLTRGQIPPKGVLLVAAADVQMRGIWVEVLAVAPNRETWVVEVFYLDGSTESPDGEVFGLLKELLDREWPDSFGGSRRVDAFGVDSGYRTHVVYSWVRKNQRSHPNSGQDVVLALDGRDGWGRPAIGTPSLVDINLAGARVKQGAKVWPVGTWPLKAAFYSSVRLEGRASGKEEDPPGYCHFPDWLDETFFRQITAEHLAEETYRGRPKRFWKLRASERDNHLLDCTVYNLALAEYLGLSRISPAEWAALAKERGMDAESAAALVATPVLEETPAAENASEPAPQPVTRPLAPAPVLTPPEPDIAAQYAELLKRNAERFR